MIDFFEKLQLDKGGIMKKINHKLLFFSFILAVFLFGYVSYFSNASMKSDDISKSTLIMLDSEGYAQMLSSVIITPTNHVIVVDGGWTYDADKLLKTIRKYNNTVDYWFITHPDPDHIGALYQILQDDSIQIGTIFCSLKPDEWYEKNAADISDFIKQFKKLLFGRNVHYVRKRDVYLIDGLKIYVLNDIYDTKYNKVNNSSIVYKIMSKNNSIIFLGDLGKEGGDLLLKESTSYLLLSNIVQMSHHGQEGVSESVYRTINPNIALWPTPEWLWTNLNGTGSYKTLLTRQWIEDIGCTSYTTAYGDITIEF